MGIREPNFKKRIRKEVFPGGFYIDPVNRQYLTDKVNSLLRLNVGLSRVFGEGTKKFPAEYSEESDSAYYSDEISNRQFIIDFVKVVDFIEQHLRWYDKTGSVLKKQIFPICPATETAGS